MNPTKAWCVTGGAGFIGSHLVEHLLSSDRCGLKVDHLLVIDALTYAGRRENLDPVRDDSRLRFEHQDLADEETILRLLRDHEIAGVFHLAAETHVDRSIDNPDPFLQSNVVATGRLLSATRRHWETLSPTKREAFRFLHVSTDEVYGALSAQDDGSFNRDSPFRPNSPYAASKAGGDCLARSFFQTYGLPVVTAVPSNTFGPRQFPEKLIPHMILKATRGEPLPVFGQGLQRREWLFVRDLCAGLCAAMTRGLPGQRYHFGPGDDHSNLEVVKALSRHLTEQWSLHLPAPPSTNFVPDRPGHDFRYALETETSRSELGWEATTPFSDALIGTIDHFMRHPETLEVSPGETYEGQRLGTTQKGNHST